MRHHQWTTSPSNHSSSSCSSTTTTTKPQEHSRRRRRRRCCFLPMRSPIRFGRALLFLSLLWVCHDVSCITKSSNNNPLLVAAFSATRTTTTTSSRSISLSVARRRTTLLLHQRDKAKEASQQQQQQQSQPSKSHTLSLSYDSWDGDDLRWFSKWRRRVFRSYRSSGGNSGGGQPVRLTLLVLNTAAYVYQVINTITWLARRYPEYWPAQAGTMMVDVLTGSAAVGPWTRYFYFLPMAAVQQQQPHRYLTAGFLHGSLLHWAVNMDALRRLPAWLETGLGSALFGTAYIVAIVTGNIGHAHWSGTGTACLGASGGICGLYGLLYASLVKMGNNSAASQVLRQMGRIVLAGMLLSNVSNASHVGGFCGGLVVGLLLGPTYGKSYAARRKWSLEVDRHSRGYRAVLGFGVEPTARPGRLAAAWLVALVWLYFGHPAVRSAPRLIWQGLVQQ